MESDGEIEYLDEDAEIVEQLVQAPAVPVAKQINRGSDFDDSDEAPLLVKRKSERIRTKKKKESEDDSDYDPSQDVMPPSPPPSKRKRPTSRKSVSVTITPKTVHISKPKISTVVLNRKKMDIRIPDYEDPLCLPVKAIKSVRSDVTKLKNWNNACVEHLKHCDTSLKPEKGQTKSSSRTIVLKNVIHKETGRAETTVWSKTCVTNKKGGNKSQIFQCLLPKYREKTVLQSFKLGAPTKKNIHDINEVILTKENHKNGEALVAYKPQERISAVYKFDENEKLLGFVERDEPEPRRVLREVASCKMCVRCYQSSWRGPTVKPENMTKKLQCPICSRSTISMYNLLTHVRAHPSSEVSRCKEQLSAILAKVVEYHYKCRICSKRLPSIKELRQHVVSHKGKTTFKCEVGNHMTT